MQELKANTGIRKQKAEFHVWVSSKPQKPDQPKPIQKRVILPFYAGILFVGGGAAIGATAMWIGATLWNPSGVVTFLLALAASIVLGAAIPIGVISIIDAVYKKRFQQEMQSSGWNTHLGALSTWRQKGKERFSDLAEQDSLARVNLRYHLDCD